MTTEKTLGQIAYEAIPNVFDVPHRWPWDHAMVADRMHWERIASAVAMECSRICTELAAEHMRQAQGGDNTGASDYRQQAAIECAHAIREAISCSSKETP